VNLQHVPIELRPAQEALDPNEDLDPGAAWRAAKEGAAETPTSERRKPSRARKES
jgi:hypothetical protein